MRGIHPRRRDGVWLVVLLSGQLVLMSAHTRQANGATALENAVAAASRPLVAAGAGLGRWIDGSLRFVGELWVARRENTRLRAELDRLRTGLERARELERENERLRRLLGMREHLAPATVAGSVITAVLSEQQQMLVLDRGRADGVLPDRPVLAWGGVVGRVVEANAHTAKVRLLTDPSSGIAGVVPRTGWEGIVVGRGGRRLEMLYLPAYAEVLPGDRVVSSGLDGVFPKGFGIGRVIHLEEGASASPRILLEPEVDLGRLEEVLVVVEGTAPAPSGDAVAAAP